MRDYIRLSGAGRLCALCRCNTSDIPWTACTNLSAWIDTVWTGAAHQAAFPDRHRLFRHVPGVTIFCYIPDWLHTKHIGRDAYFLGSVLMAMFTEIGIAGTNTEILQYIWDHISEGYKRLDVRNDRITGLTFGMIQSSAAKLPQLKMRGNQMKKLAPVIRLIWVEHMDEDRPHHRHIKLALDDCIRIDEIMDDHSKLFALPPVAARDLETHCFQFCQMMTLLIGHFQPDANLFSYTIKTHYLLHFGKIASYINPNLAACHQGEDFMKVVKRLVTESADGVGALLSTKKAMQKYARGLAMDFGGFSPV